MSFNPNWTSHPGATIQSVLFEKNVSVKEFAQRLEWSIDNVNRLINGSIPIDENLADLLQNTLGATKHFWLNRQSIYDSRCKILCEEKETWLNNLPVKDMINRGLIARGKDVFQECLSFFGVENLQTWNDKYKDLSISFRKSPSYISEMSSVITWMRQAEIQTNNYVTKTWNKALFEELLQTKIKSLIRVKNPSIFIPELIRLCAECGIRLAIVPCIGKCRASGASSFITQNNALMILSFRHLSDDHFWFTFFHEAGHLVMHDKRLRLEDNNGISECEEELDANAFASEHLISYDYRDELINMRRNKRIIIEFAQKAQVSPGIVIGQLQHLGYIRFEYLNSYKRYYSWDEINKGLNKVMS